jgi:hypothetical protein
MVGPLAQEPRLEIRQIDCSDAGYRKLREWLKAEQVTLAVMKSGVQHSGTGGEGVLANSAEVKKAPCGGAQRSDG